MRSKYYGAVLKKGSDTVFHHIALKYKHYSFLKSKKKSDLVYIKISCGSLIFV